MTRQTGVTTQQMQEAPRGALYVWCNASTDYARKLAQRIKRPDLVIRSPRWLVDNADGYTPTAVVVDHAACLTPQQQYALDLVRAGMKAR
jgi:hypothetical protein